MSGNTYLTAYGYPAEGFHKKAATTAIRKHMNSFIQSRSFAMPYERNRMFSTELQRVRAEWKSINRNDLHRCALAIINMQCDLLALARLPANSALKWETGIVSLIDYSIFLIKVKHKKHKA